MAAARPPAPTRGRRDAPRCAGGPCRERWRALRRGARRAGRRGRAGRAAPCRSRDAPCRTSSPRRHAGRYGPRRPTARTWTTRVHGRCDRGCGSSPKGSGPHDRGSGGRGRGRRLLRPRSDFGGRPDRIPAPAGSSRSSTWSAPCGRGRRRAGRRGSKSPGGTRPDGSGRTNDRTCPPSSPAPSTGPRERPPSQSTSARQAVRPGRLGSRAGPHPCRVRPPGTAPRTEPAGRGR